MIFAAGLGTRLMPFTHAMPKALVPVAGIPMIEILIRNLLKNNISEIIVNVHHFSDQVIGFLDANNNFGADISISNESDLLLDTGGGLKKASWFFGGNEPFLVQNVDVISDVNYFEMLERHKSYGALATLAVCRRETSRYLLFKPDFLLCGWENTKTEEIILVEPEHNNPEKFAFSGIHIIDPSIFGYLYQDGKFSIIDTYLKLAARFKICGFEHNPENWVDMGKPDELHKAELLLKKLNYLG